MPAQTTSPAPEFPLHYRIRLALDVSGVEPEELAEDMGVHPNTIHNYAAGRTKPKRLALKAIAEKTGVSLQWLEHGDDRNTSSILHGKHRQWHLSWAKPQVSGPWYPAVA
jgi:transcriptional regulator with XRE-family HTH domain